MLQSELAQNEKPSVQGELRPCADSRDRPAQEGDHPAGVDSEAHPMEEAVHRLRPSNHSRSQRKQEMKRHAVERAQAGDGVPFRHVPRGHAVEEHEVGAEVVAQQAEPENEQMFPVQPLLSCTEHRPGVKHQGEVHKDHRLKQHLSISSSLSHFIYLPPLKEEVHLLPPLKKGSTCSPL